MIHKYIGNSICCGTYSIIHLLECDIDVDLFELTTGVPFGIKGSIEGKRLLTTFIDPNYGIEVGMKNWGMSGKKYCFKDKQQAWEKLLESLERNNEIIMGPLDMMKLSYIPLSTLDSGMDHYIHVKKKDAYHVLIKDSEGYLAVTKNLKELFKLWNIRNVIEAEGYYVFRTIDKRFGESMERAVLLRKSYRQMKKNVCRAEAACYGSHVFGRIMRYTGNDANTGWRTGLMYDFTHLLQRKVITEKMLEELLLYEERQQYISILNYIRKQIDILPLLYRDVEERNAPSKRLLLDMEKAEREIYNILKISD